MTGPYRDSDAAAPADAPRDAGIVGDVIAQFADIYAFYRELVQNSIDAGTPNVNIVIAYDRVTQQITVEVRDRGEGMTRDILENQLLVLFRSTKEKDDTKIGKFGIGFASVLAPNPDVVSVHTARDGRRLTLHLYRDLTYELFDAGPATQTGTTVILVIAMKPPEVDAFVRASLDALHRWCRHATVPIDVLAGTTTTRVDKPLGLSNTLVQVTKVTDAGQLTVVVGLGPSYVGFFNHGLMLHETTEPLVGALSVKIQDARLGHTLSRDDVRRDEHFEHALDFARDVARNELVQATETKLRELAEAANLDALERMMGAAITGGLPLSRWYMPLVEPLGDQKMIDLGEHKHAWASVRASPLTEALAATGTPVVRCKDVSLLSADVQRAIGCKLADVHTELTSIAPVDRTPQDEALVGKLIEILDRVYRDPGAVVFAELVGVHVDRLAIAGVSSDAHVVDREEAAKNPFALLGRRPLVLSIAHPIVRAARQHDDPRLAASHLARAVLLHHRLLDEDRSHKILEIALGGLS
jgi:molecular chaperone HtpG